MADEEKEYEFGERPLKKISLSKIENAIAKSVSDVAESKYEASILNIDFEPCRNAWLSDTIEIRLRLKKPMENKLLGELSEEEK